MLLLTHAYLVPANRLDRHNELVQQLASRLASWGVGVEVLLETNDNFSPPGGPDLRIVQMLRFQDAAHFERVRREESADRAYQQRLAELIELLNLPAQTLAGTHVPGHYQRLMSW
ncbi:MAG: hypothetical protein ACK4PI_07030 [Tepidisphaerales bacterium]